MHRILNAVCVILFALTCATALRAGEPATATENPPSKVLVRERTVYVPYEKLKETFEKEGRGVFLPYEEFLKLWNAAQPKEKPPEEINPPAIAVVSGGSYTGVAGENAVRFEVTYKIRALGKNWSEVVLPLKNVAVESVTLSDPLAVFSPKGDGYALNLPKPGEYTLTLAFSVHVASKPGQRRIEFGIPPTAVSRLEMTIPEKDVRVEIEPKMAASQPTQENGATKLLAFVGNSDHVAVTWMPPDSRIEKGKAVLIASQSMHVELGERILRLDSAVNFRIESNEEDRFRVKLPEGMRLLSVKGSTNPREWSEKNGELIVQLHTPARDAFGLLLRFEKILDKTPDRLDISFPIVLDALREDGYITVGHDASLRLRVENSKGLSQIDARELPQDMRRENLFSAFRYVAHPLALAFSIEQIKPQIQSNAVALASIGTEEDTLSGWVDYTITKVGIFQAKLKFPARYEVASVGEPQTVEDFQAALEGAEKILTVNLKNKALGNFRLPFKLTAPGRAAPGDLIVESVQVLDTQQDKGLLGISAPKAFKLTTSERVKMTPANVQTLYAAGLLAQLPRDYEQPLAYSYTQQPASVKLGVERRQTEIRVTGLHTVIVSEAGLELSHKLEYVVEYAATDKLFFSMPSSLDEKLFSVQCAGMKEKRKVSEEQGRSKWEITLQEKVLGVIRVDINYKENLKGLEPEKPQEIPIPDIRAEDVKSQEGYIAVRKESALEIEPKTTNLEPLEAVNLPAEMRSSKSAGNIYLAYRYFQPVRSLLLKLTRHVSIEVSNTVVDLMHATFVVSDLKRVKARIEMCVENARGEQYLALKLPHDATVFNAAVAGVGLNPLKREEDKSTLLKLAASSTPFWVQIDYSAPLEAGEGTMGWAGSIELKAPEVLGGVPVNKIEASLYVPDEFAYYNFNGTLHVRNAREPESNVRRWVDSHVADGAFTLIEPSLLQNLPPIPGILGKLPTQGKLYRLETLSPLGNFSASYCERKLLTLLDVLVFLGALLLGWLLIRRHRYSALWVCAGFILVPLCLRWLSESEAAEVPQAWLVAGLALAAFFLVERLLKRIHDWREERIARAPDPFLEDAVAPVTAASTTTAPIAPVVDDKPKVDDSTETGAGK